MHQVCNKLNPDTSHRQFLARKLPRIDVVMEMAGSVSDIMVKNTAIVRRTVNI